MILTFGIFDHPCPRILYFLFCYFYFIFTNYSPTSKMWHKANFYAGFNRFYFKVFFSLTGLHTGSRAKSVLLSVYNWRKNSLIHTIPEGISTIWKANGLIQGLNLRRRRHEYHWSLFSWLRTYSTPNIHMSLFIPALLFYLFLFFLLYCWRVFCCCFFNSVSYMFRIFIFSVLGHFYSIGFLFVRFPLGLFVVGGYY